MRALGRRELHKGFAVLAIGSLTFVQATVTRDLFGWSSVSLKANACAVDVLLGLLDARVTPIALGIPASIMLLSFTRHDFDPPRLLAHTAGCQSVVVEECYCAGIAAGFTVFGAVLVEAVLSMVAGAPFLNWEDAASYGAWRAGMPMSTPMPFPVLGFSVNAFSALFALLVFEICLRWVLNRAWWSMVAILPYILLYTSTVGPFLAIAPESFSSSLPWSSIACSVLLFLGTANLSWLFSRSRVVRNKDFYGG